MERRALHDELRARVEHRRELAEDAVAEVPRSVEKGVPFHIDDAGSGKPGRRVLDALGEVRDPV
jgi:hypothetical protein